MLSSSLLAIHLTGAIVTFFLIAKTIADLFRVINNNSTIKYLNYAASFQVVSGGLLSISRSAAAIAACSKLLLYIALIVGVQIALLARQRQLVKEPAIIRSMFKAHAVNLGMIGAIAAILL